MNIIILLCLPSDPRPLSLCFLGKTATAVKLTFLWTGYRNQAERTHGSITDFSSCLYPWTPAEWSQPRLCTHASPPYSVPFPTLQEQKPSLDLSFPASYYSFLKSLFCPIYTHSHQALTNHSAHFHINKVSDRVSAHILLDLLAAGATVSHSLLICMFST